MTRARYGSFGYGEVYGKGQGDYTEEQLRRLVDKIKLYERWRARMFKSSHMSLVICERVCRREDSLEQIRKDERIGWETARFGPQFGPNEYSIEAGWGTRLADQPKDNVVGLGGDRITPQQQKHPSSSLQAAIMGLINEQRDGMLFTTIIGVLELCKPEVIGRAFEDDT